MDPVPVSTRKDRVHKVTQQSDMEASRETEKKQRDLQHSIGFIWGDQMKPRQLVLAYKSVLPEQRLNVDAKARIFLGTF